MSGHVGTRVRASAGLTEADKPGARFLSHHLPVYPSVTDQTGGFRNRNRNRNTRGIHP